MITSISPRLWQYCWSVEDTTRRITLDGLIALDPALKFQPEVILLDLVLPGMGGYAAAQQLGAQPETCNAVLIALTGYGQPEDRVCTRAAYL